MAISPSHKFGQIIGDTLEAAILPLLIDFAKQHGLIPRPKEPEVLPEGAKVLLD